MLRTSLIFGVLAGLVVAIPMFTLLALAGGDHGAGSQLTGYTLMLIALSFVFVGVKRYRDREQGGVIKFLPAFLLGLGISAVAGAIYVIGWEITLALTHYQFIHRYAAAMIEAQQAAGVSGAELEAFRAQMQQMVEAYANPLFRLPMTFVEIFPVGVLVSLISALLLRNHRFLPARQAAATA